MPLVAYLLLLSIIGYCSVLSSTVDCPSCPAGFYNDPDCSSTGSPACLPCPAKTFSSLENGRSKCEPCSICGEDTFELYSCTAISNAFCQTCSWKGSLSNPSYMSNCVNYEGHSFRSDKQFEVIIKDSTARFRRYILRTKVKKNAVRKNSLHTLLSESKVLSSLNQANTGNPINLKANYHLEDKPVKDESRLSNIPVSSAVSTDLRYKRSIAVDPTRGGTDDYVIDEYSGWAEDKVIDDLIVDYNGDFPLEDRSAEVQTDDGSGVIVEAGGSGEEQSATTASEIVDIVIVTEKKGATGDGGLLTTNLDHVETTETGTTLSAVEVHTSAYEVVSSGGTLAVWIILLTVLAAAIVFFFIGFFLYSICHKRKCLCFAVKKKHYVPVSVEQGEMVRMYSMIDYRNNNQQVSSFTGENEPLNPPDASAENISEDDGPLVLTAPINIEPEEPVLDENMSELNFSTGFTLDWEIINTGNTVKLRLRGNGNDVTLLPSVTGGALGDKIYTLDHVHFHWGADDTRGSEHTIGGRAFPAEFHLVYWDSSDFSSYPDASHADGGLVVLATLTEVVDVHNHSLKPLIDCLSSIEYKGESRDLSNQAIDVSSLLPTSTRSYWWYQGSENSAGSMVTWLLFHQRLEMSMSQLSAFRTLRNHERSDSLKLKECTFLVDNFRMIVPTGKRVIRTSRPFTM